MHQNSTSNLPTITLWCDLNVLIVPYNHVEKATASLESNPRLSEIVARKGQEKIKSLQGKATIYKFPLRYEDEDSTRVKDKGKYIGAQRKSESLVIEKNQNASGQNSKKSISRPSPFSRLQFGGGQSRNSNSSSLIKVVQRSNQSKRWNFNVIVMDPTMIRTYGHYLKLSKREDEDTKDEIKDELWIKQIGQVQKIITLKILPTKISVI